MEIKITQDIIDYIKCHRPQFELPVPELGEVWKVDRIVKYPVACNGEPVVEVSRGKSWMRLPVHPIIFSENQIWELLQKLNKSEDKKSTDKIVYKVRHKATGLYYTPGCHSKNLTKDGKIYKNKNCLLSYMGKYGHWIKDAQGNVLHVKADDFELVPFKITLTEIK